MTTLQRQQALDRRAAALSIIGLERHILRGKKACLQDMQNRIISDKVFQTRLIQLNKDIERVDTKFLVTFSEPLDSWLDQGPRFLHESFLD